MAAAHPPEHPQDADQDDHIDDGDQIQEHARDAGADQARVMMQDEASCSTGPTIALSPNAMRSASPNTTEEWPSEKKNPTASGRCPSFISLRVVLSIAAMWSASNAWRSPSV